MQSDLRIDRFFHFLSKVFVCVVATSSALFATTASQTLTITVGNMNETTLSGNTVSLDSSKGVYNDGVVEVYDNSTTFDVTTNESGKKFTASLSEDMPQGVKLYLRISGGEASGTGTVLGSYRELTTSPTDLITGMDDFTLDDGTLDFKMEVNEESDPITQNYTLSFAIVSS